MDKRVSPSPFRDNLPVGYSERFRAKEGESVDEEVVKTVSVSQHHVKQKFR